MNVRRVAAKLAVVGIMVGAVAAASAAPASAAPNTACASAWDVVDAAREAMGITFSDEEFWYYHRLWAEELTWISRYC